MIWGRIDIIEKFPGENRIHVLQSHPKSKKKDLLRHFGECGKVSISYHPKGFFLEFSSKDSFERCLHLLHQPHNSLNKLTRQPDRLSEICSGVIRKNWKQYAHEKVDRIIFDLIWDSYKKSCERGLISPHNKNIKALARRAAEEENCNWLFGDSQVDEAQKDWIYYLDCFVANKLKPLLMGPLCTDGKPELDPKHATALEDLAQLPHLDIDAGSGCRKLCHCLADILKLHHLSFSQESVKTSRKTGPKSWKENNSGKRILRVALPRNWAWEFGKKLTYAPSGAGKKKRRHENRYDEYLIDLAFQVTCKFSAHGYENPQEFLDDLDDGEREAVEEYLY